MVMVRLGPTVDGVLASQLVDLWVRVTEAGGAVGFVAPVTAEDVEPAATTLWSRAAAGLVDLAVAFDEGAPVGMGVLVPDDGVLTSHVATVRRLMCDPSWRGRGVGRVLLAALEQAAVRRGVERVVVEVRDGTDLPAWYARRGYSEDGVLPDRVRVAGAPVAVRILSKPVGRAAAAPEAPRLAVRRLDAGLPLPRYVHAGDAGLDLHAGCDVALSPGERAVVPTGLAIALPAGHVGLVHPRSGLAARSGVALVNAPGTIDEGYRGEVKVILVNLDPSEPVQIARGDRIAQLVVQRVERVRVEEVAELPPAPEDGSAVRGAGGFGSSGR